jgi:excinuclease ABC subunit C
MWIDSFDNSNTQGSDAVAGCVVFKKARACKSDYKKFEIKTVVGPDDYESMREVVRRRYSRLVEEGSPLPDLIIADGGLGQMTAIKEVVNGELGLQIPVAGLKKDNRHRTNTLLYGDPVQEFGMKVTDEVFRLLVEIQDEVHRFAITFHKNKRSKSQIKSELDDIQGVGPATKQKILQHFGSVARARRAEKQEWVDLLGTSTGSKVYEYFQGKITR